MELKNFNVSSSFSLSEDKRIGFKNFTYTILGMRKVSGDESKKLFSTFDNKTLSINSKEVILPGYPSISQD